MTMRLTRRDIDVIEAFTEQESDESKKLTSEGDTLIQHGGGSKGPVAEWRSGKIYFLSTGGASNDTIHRAIKKLTPKSELGGWGEENPPDGLDWISIVGDEDRKSSLGWSDKDPLVLQVIGVLPHNYKFEPNSVEDAEMFIDYLQTWIENQ